MQDVRFFVYGRIGNELGKGCQACARPFHTSRWLAFVKVPYFPPGEETLEQKRL